MAATAFADVADGLHLLGSAEFRDIYGGILCAIDVDNDPIATYETLLKFNPPAVDLLLPHANWSSPPPGSGYADWLIAVFERWYSAPVQETRIRLFTELIQLILGGSAAVEGLGLGPATLIVVETDGTIRQLDSLSSAYSGAADTGLHVFTDSFDAALEHPTTVARQIGVDALAPGARRVRSCGSAAGAFTRTATAGRGIPQPLGLLRRPDEADYLRQRPGDPRCDRAQYGSISAVRRIPCTAARASGCSAVRVSEYLRSASARS